MTPAESFQLFVENAVHALTEPCYCIEGECTSCLGSGKGIGHLPLGISEEVVAKTCGLCEGSGKCGRCQGTGTYVPPLTSSDVTVAVLMGAVGFNVARRKQGNFADANEIMDIAHEWVVQLAACVLEANPDLADLTSATLAKRNKFLAERSEQIRNPKLSIKPLTTEELAELGIHDDD